MLRALRSERGDLIELNNTKRKRVMRKAEDGLWDRGASHGEITGSGPGFEDAMRKFRARQERASQIGSWRHNEQNTSEGSYIDRDWDIIDY